VELKNNNWRMLTDGFVVMAADEGLLALAGT
jgi:hypothetical protein